LSAVEPPGQTSYRALIVDFGGVLTTPLQDAMAEFCADTGIELQDLVRAALGAYTGHEDSLVTDFETGKISEEEFARAFSARLKEISGRVIEPEGLVRRLFRVRLEESMLDTVRSARRSGLKTGLLSNSWGTDLYPRRRLAELFDAVVISGEVGLRKPDPEIFRLTTDKLGVEPRECVFVDDHPGHLQAALEVGMTTVLHRSPEVTLAELRGLLGIELG
jgi:epoxide hydrolase-like predicted phosphatase